MLTLRLATLLSLTLLGSAASWGQLPDRLALHFQQYGGSNRVSVAGAGAEMNHQLFLGENTLLSLGFGYSQMNLEDRSAVGADRSRQLRTFTPNLTMLRSLDREHNLLVFLRPGIYGDGKGTISEEFRVEGGFVLNKTLSSKLTLGLGLARGTNFGRDLVVPVVQFMYTPSSQVYLTGLLPARAGLWYVHSSKLDLGAIFRLEGSVYNIEESNVAQAQQLGFAAAQLGAAAKYNFFDQNFLTMEVGVTALRRYEWQRNQGPTMNLSRLPLTDRELDRVPYLRFAFQQSF